MLINNNLATILSLLEKNYPDAKIALNYNSNWELLVSVILSAQCTDIMVNKVTPSLFNKYKSVKDYADADLKELETDIKKTGFFREKAKRISESAKIIIEKFNGQVPNSMESILTLPGVARKTANVVLGNAYKIAVGIAVDTHVKRISQRLHLVDLDKIGGKQKNLDYKKDADPVKIEIELMKNIPKSMWFKLTYQIIDHGRSLCKAQNPNCERCFLKNYCPASRV